MLGSLLELAECSDLDLPHALSCHLRHQTSVCQLRPWIWLQILQTYLLAS